MSRRSRQAKTDLPPKNRVGGFSSYSETSARFFVTQPLESHRENGPTPTTTASGMRYFGYRFYSPNLGRWLSRDPLGEFGGQNLYGFVQNAPLHYVDPFGLEFSVELACCGLVPGDAQAEWSWILQRLPRDC